MADQPVQTIRNQIYNIIRSALWRGEYTPGQRLQEVELANRLHVSRSPVREALRQLVADGLVIEIPNKGVYVKRFTVQDIDEIFDVRLMLESYAIRHAAEHMTDGQRAQILAILRSLQSSYEARDMDRYVADDDDLHKFIVQLGGNSLVDDLYYRVRSMSQQFRVRSLTSHNRFHDSVQEHRDLVTALVTGETDKALEINASHLALACKCIKERLTQEGVG